MPDIPLSEIHEAPPGAGLRKVAAGKAADDGLRDSIASMGMLVPVVVMPRAGGGYALLDGRRRVAAARALSALMIPAEIREPNPAVPAEAIEAATNIVRAPMHPVDQWRTVAQLMAQHGFTVKGAAQALGLTERATKRMALLSKVHPPILEAMAKAEGTDAAEIFGPDDDILPDIARAPVDVQAKAWAEEKNKAKPYWFGLASRCRGQDYLQADAEFDEAIAAECGVTWQEDLFAEPRGDGAPAFFTRDKAAFFKAQRLWIERVKIPAMQAQGYQAAFGEEARHGGAKDLPNHEPVGGNPDKAPKAVVRQYFLDSYSGRVQVRLWKRPKAALPEAAPAGDDAPPATGKAAKGKAPAPDRAPPAAPQDPPKPTKVLTKKGHALVAQAKTDALHAWLRSGDGTLDSLRLLRAMVVALAGSNVVVTCAAERQNNRDRMDFEDLAARLVGADGSALQVDADTLLNTAAEALCRILHFDPHGEDHAASGPAAAWVSRMVNCPYPRFDTPEILAEASTAALRDLAEWQKLNSARPKEALLRDLAGAVPGWKPPGVVFDGAPGPARDDPEREAA